MVYFVGAGSGAVDLITVRGKNLLETADIVIYAGSLVNPDLLLYCKKECAIYNSAEMTLEEVIAVMKQGAQNEQKIVRLHTGDPCLYGAIKEQMDWLKKEQIAYEICPGVSSFCAAAAALETEYTLPEVSQSVVITRMAGRTPVPEREKIAAWARHQATMVIFLSMGQIGSLAEELKAGGYQKDTPAAIVYKASWPEQKVVHCTVETLQQAAQEAEITKTALIIVGDVLDCGYERSKLYDPGFSTGYRKASHADKSQKGE